MNYFRTTTYISEIIEQSETQSVIIFKYSSECRSSFRLKSKLEKMLEEKTLTPLIYQVTVQTEPVLSKKIAELFKIKHETPQIIILKKGKVIYSAHHNSIKTEEFASIKTSL